MRPPVRLGLLTEGRVLPEPPLDARKRRAIIDLLRRAWAEVQGDLTPDLYEPDVTTRLVLRLNNLLRRPDRTVRAKAVVNGAADDAKAVTIVGVRLIPDIQLNLRDPSAPLTVEAKVIRSPASIGEYCGVEGMGAFVSGEYGWERREGVMLGYVRDGSTLGQTLVPCLEALRTKRGDPLRQRACGVPTLDGEVDSVHDRPGLMVPETQLPLGEITLWHVWLVA
jgi:hypothetical protein